VFREVGLDLLGSEAGGVKNCHQSPQLLGLSGANQAVAQHRDRRQLAVKAWGALTHHNWGILTLGLVDMAGKAGSPLIHHALVIPDSVLVVALEIPTSVPVVHYQVSRGRVPSFVPAAHFQESRGPVRGATHRCLKDAWARLVAWAHCPLN